MTRLGILRWTAMLGMASAALNGCRPEQPPAEDLLMVRMLGLDHLERGELPEAEEQFQKIVALAPREPLGYANLGVTYLRAGRYEDAEAQLRRAQRLDPTSAQVGLTMAKLYSLTGRAAEARAVLERLLRGGAADTPVLYALAELDGQVADSAALRRREDRLRQVVALAPANLAVRLELMESLARRGEADSVVRHLEEVRRIPPEPPQEARPHLERSIRLLQAGRLTEATTPLDRFVRMMELTPSYQASLADVSWIEGPLVGRPVLTYSPEFLVTLRAQGLEVPAGVVSFTDATTDAGLPDPRATPASPEPSPPGDPHATALALGDFSGDGTPDLIASSRPPDQQLARTRLYAGRGGHFLDVTERWGISLPATASHATVADFDNDGRLDLFLVGADGRAHLLRNEGSGQFTDVTTTAGLAAVRGARSAVFVDLDHDGDLDLVLVGSEALVVFRNNLDGTFTDVTAGTGLAAADGPRAIAIGDFDDDGRIDLFVANEHGPDILFRNTGGGRFSDRTAQSRITSGGSGAVAVGDFDNDGLFDLFVASATGGPPTLWHNNGDGTFTADDRSAAALEQLGSTSALAAEFVDYDNDGWLDLVVAGAPLTTGGSGGGTFLFQNDGRGVFTDRSEILPPTVRSGSWTTLAVSDFDGDGDQDLFVAGPQGVRLLRNEDGNAHLAMQVRLLALRDGSGKNNTFGIGANVELRAGDIYQTRVVTGPVTHFGLGPHLKGDVLRVQWPNGVPQTIYLPGTDQDVLELEHLKGSCPFLYTWDGERFRFVTDVMWRSALGMPLGIMSGGGAGGAGGAGGGTAWAPAAPSEEYLRIPGDALRPRDGRYVLQFTEELWETAYLDEIQLLAVDHPDSVDVFVDERFVPPAPADLRLFQVVRPRVPRSATNERGEDLLPALRANDDLYVSNLTPLRYQGLVEPHDLILDLGEEAGTPGTFLFLRGWIYPGDASINVALSQQSRLQPRAPSLEVRDARGRWITAIADIGFPSGKDKTIVIDLAGKFPTDDRHVRIRTNMQIYWGHAFVSVDPAHTPLRVTPLPLLAADLQYRGFSRMYRRGGRYGPHWFDYADVSPESPWRPIEGAFTRFGDVLPLLSSADDMYAIMGPGDGITLEFDAASEQALPPRWTRTFLLYTVGWIKDADLNTAFGNTVEPLPFHGLEQYPYPPGESYPADSALHRYRQEYNTRVVKLR
jgi:tetratricopeptide (TPR) repeat protein